MENTDIDMVISIPDTPDRPVRRSSVSREVKRRPHSPEAPVRHHREEYHNYLNGRARPVPEIGENREHCDLQTENRHCSRASGSNPLFRRVEKDKGKSISTDICSTRVERNPVLNLNQRNGHTDVITASRCLPSEDIRELRTSNGSSPLRGDHNSFMLPGKSNKGKEKADCGSVSNVETIDLSSDNKHKRGTKRLVRNGCISPHGIGARSRQAADTNPKDTVIVEQEIAPEAASSISIREIVSENDIFGRARGRRPDISSGRVGSRDGSEGWVSTRGREFNMDHEMNQRDKSDTRGISSSVSRLDVHEIDASEREARQQRRRKNGISTSMASNEPEVTVIRSSEEPSSSRPPRTQNRQRHSASSPDVRVFQGPSRALNEPHVTAIRSSGEPSSSRPPRTQNRQRHSASSPDVRVFQGPSRVLNEPHVTAIRSSGEPSSSRRPRTQNRQRHSAQVLEFEDPSPDVRVFQGPSRALNEPDVTAIRSSGEPSSSRPPRTQNHQRHGTHVSEIEDLSPDVRDFQGPRHTENNVSDVNVRQIEADEILARELQEQLYQEATVIRDEQIDENIARWLEQEENSSRASSSPASTRTNRSSNTNAANRGGRSRLEARLQQSSSRRRSNPPQGRAPFRAPPRGRGPRLGRALNLSFPNDMGLETRLDILEGLEIAIGHSMNNSHLLHMDRDFTEDDYELLLALDENNHRHAGASTNRINNLPESTVQTDNFQETCVICLETPTIGDTIRHLPCLHKFHKDISSRSNFIKGFAKVLSSRS